MKMDVAQEHTTYNPFPITLVVEDLQPTDRLAEKQRDGTKIGMARGIELTDELVLFKGSGSVVHVSKMILALYIVLVISHELVLVRKLKEDSEELQQFDDHLVVAFLKTCLHISTGLDIFVLPPLP